jgi:hypothetical protein
MAERGNAREPGSVRDLAEPQEERPGEKRRGGDVALVHLVAHEERPRHEGSERHAVTGPERPAKEGARLVPEPRQRSSTEASWAPKRRTRPSPLLMATCARFRNVRFSTTKMGIEHVMRPVIGPTAP